MNYKELLKKFNAAEGNLVEVKTKSEAYKGYIVPSPSNNSVTLKLETGYNVGIDCSNVVGLKKISDGKAVGKPKNIGIGQNKALPTIMILHTGGTIASRVNYTTGGVFAGFSSEDFLSMFPKLKDVANFETKQILNVMSEDMRFEYYQKIAKAIKEEAESGKAKGIIIGHGTDTLAYTAAALSFMFEGLNLPVILVGAQRSSDRGSTDAASNLYCAAKFIAEADFAGVAICMHENTGDESCVILPAAKTRKMHTSRRDAFKAINARPIARVDYNSGKVEFIEKNYPKAGNPGNFGNAENATNSGNGKNSGNFGKTANSGKLILKDKFEEKVGILRSKPNLLPEEIDFYREKKFKGLIFEATGLGQVPINSKENEPNLKALKALVDSGCIVGITSQCIYGRVHADIYTNCRRLAELGCIFCEDMLTETAFVKLAWLLGNFSQAEAKKLLAQNLKGEISKVTRVDAFKVEEMNG